jgi:starch synthase
MNIAIASAGRFHVLDLARELERLGHTVKFYSYVPTKRCAKFGLSESSSKSLFYFIIPILVLQKISPKKLDIFFNHLIAKSLDFLVSYKLEFCDIFICMSGIYIKSLEVAKKKYHAKVIVERGSNHILEQEKILKAISKLKLPLGQFMHEKNSIIDINSIKRELKSYELADFISIPSRHVERSFLKQKIKPSKILKNPYGVDLDSFFPKKTDINFFRKKSNFKYLIFVGGWSFRKGADLLSRVIISMDNVILMHVGPIIDAPFPNHPRFVHFKSVDQNLLTNYYNVADAFVLPSREEGLALVLNQAFVSGLPIVCSDQTGGIDIKKQVINKNRIIIFKSESLNSLKHALVKVFKLRKIKNLDNFNFKKDRESLSWRGYGLRYHQKLLEIFNE